MAEEDKALGRIPEENAPKKALKVSPRSPQRGNSALPRAGVVRLMKKAGKFRFDKEAVIELHSFLEASASDIAKRSGKLAALAKRKTVTKEDVGFASTE